MDVILQTTNLYMLALLLSLSIERIMEIVNAAWNYIEWNFDLHAFWTKRAVKLQEEFHRKASINLWDRNFDLSGLINQIRKKLSNGKKGPSGKIPVISADLVRHSAIVVANRIVSLLFGILFCFITKINLVEVITVELKLDYKILTEMPVWIALIISGVLIGSGTEPVHSLIKNIEKRRKK